MRNIGIIGAGGIVEHHLEAASRHRQTKVVHIADIHLERARHLADQYGISNVSNDPGEIILDDRVDMVIVALPTHLHYEWLMRCAKAGKDILTEKPLCRTVSQAKRVLQACSKHKVRLSVGYMRRFSPAWLKVRSLVQSGALGRPVTWRISTLGQRTEFYRVPNGWTWDKQKGGGCIMDVSIHAFDFACWVLGHPIKMFAQSERISDSVSAPAQAHAFINFVNGDHLEYNAIWQEKNFGSFGSAICPSWIVGPEGTITMDSDFEFTWYFAHGRKRHFKWDPEKMGPGGLFYRQLDSFVRQKNDISLVTGEESLESLWIAEKIIDAGRGGRLFHVG